MGWGAPCCQSAGRRARIPRPALFVGTPHKATLYPLGARAKRGCEGNRADRALRGLEAKEVAALLRRVRQNTPTHPRMESHREQRKSGGPTPQAAGPPSDRSRAPSLRARESDSCLDEKAAPKQDARCHRRNRPAGGLLRSRQPSASPRLPSLARPPLYFVREQWLLAACESGRRLPDRLDGRFRPPYSSRPLDEGA